MSIETLISWTDATWNIARGCTKVDEDCKFCYMYRESLDNSRYNPLEVVRTKTVFNMPLKYKETSSKVWAGRPLIFTCSLTDFFHESIDGYRHEAWDIIRSCPHLIFQILTKRPERITEHLPADWGDGWDNVWLGTSVGSNKSTQRIADLCYVKCKFRFLSLEPLHGPVDVHAIEAPDHDDAGASRIYPLEGRRTDMGRPCYDTGKIHWVITGGESGNENGKYRYRPCEISWIEEIVNHCKKNNTPVFVKQLGTHLSKLLILKSRHGSDITEFPEHLRLQQFPTLK